VQALSPTLVRVEVKGPLGFEDRNTFMAVNRSFSGISIWKESSGPIETVLSTDHYKIHLQADVGVYWYITNLQGDTIYAAIDDLANSNDPSGPHRIPNLLHWPSPLDQQRRFKQAYALIDSPRFVPPPWGPTPMPDPSTVQPALRATNGFDFRNNVDGDTYVFLLGSTLQSWTDSRQEFLHLAGPCPLLPDYAYGTWFTRWHNYTQQEAEAEVMQWASLKLPLDVFGLDMNWRNTSSAGNDQMSASVQNSDGSDWFYDHPDTLLFPAFDSWFDFLKKAGLRTYHNDHPYPVAARGAGGLQASVEEVQFRWDGLTKWLKSGIDFWWFDRNWRFSIPPPFVNTSRTGADWEGLDNAAWGSYVYFETDRVFKESEPNRTRPMALTKFAPWDWRAGFDALGQQEHPAQHRFPVWWTGDGVPLLASVESMVDAGVHGFKPFVHSDCGGDYRGSAGDLLRWTAHCAFGTILRFHGSDHRLWSYDDQHIVDTGRQYLDARYRLLPSLIAAGHRATATGFPLAARGDLYWPELAPESRSNSQYIFLEDILVAPIWQTDTNETTRTVWVPPGEWQDCWNGSIVTGPQTLTVTQPYERQPMWYRRDGGLLVLADSVTSTVDTQDWTTLTLEAFPAAHSAVTERVLFEKGSVEHTSTTNISMDTNEDGIFRIHIDNAVARAWVVRVHLLPGQRASSIVLDGEVVSGLHIEPSTAAVFPLEGAGSNPAPLAGPVVEVQLSSSVLSRLLSVQVRSV